MTASVSRPSITAAAASACPGRSSCHPKESRATRAIPFPDAPTAARSPPLFPCKLGSAITPTTRWRSFACLDPREPIRSTDRKSRHTPLFLGGGGRAMADFTKRFRRNDDTGTNAGRRGGSVAAGEPGGPPPVQGETAGQRARDHAHGDHDHDGIRDRDEGRGGVATRDRAATGTAASARDVRARQRDAFGGFNWGSAFFGWLVAVGLGALLT